MSDTNVSTTQLQLVTYMSIAASIAVLFSGILSRNHSQHDVLNGVAYLDQSEVLHGAADVGAMTIATSNVSVLVAIVLLGLALTYMTVQRGAPKERA